MPEEKDGESAAGEPDSKTPIDPQIQPNGNKGIPAQSPNNRTRNNESDTAELAREIRGGEKWLIGIGVATILVNILLACIYFGQLKEMRKATQATRDAVRVASRTLDETQRSNARQAAQAEAASKSSAASSQQALRSFIDSSRLDQRAWVGISTIDPFSFTPNDSFGLRLRLVNTGHTPALHVHTLTILHSQPSTEAFKAIYGKVPDKEIQSDSVILANGATFVDTPKYPLNQLQIDAVKNKTITAYAYGNITYLDAFGRHHLTKFCKVIAETNKAEDCGTYNFAD